MWKFSASLLFTTTVLLLAAGCKYDGSFMQMDSNSGSPFFGLQWAVDSGSRPPRADAMSDPRSSSGSVDLSAPLRTDRLQLQSPGDRLRDPLKGQTSLVTVSQRQRP